MKMPLAAPKTYWNRWRNRRRQRRMLEIGPGSERLAGFETLNIVDSAVTDYVLDATRPLPFDTGTFEVIYASHILEHVPWYRTPEVLGEWVRLLAPGGKLEIWVPDGLKICEAFVDAERGRENRIDEDGWYRLNPEKDPCLWASGRLFTYGDGHGTLDHPNWHRALFSPRLLESLLKRAGLAKVRRMERSEVRGYDHGWINMGYTGEKR